MKTKLLKKCSLCKKLFPKTEYKIKSDGKRYKSCNTCLETILAVKRGIHQRTPKVKVKCLGVLHRDKDFYFMAMSKFNRLCPKCKNYTNNLY